LCSRQSKCCITAVVLLYYIILFKMSVLSSQIKKPIWVTLAA
jgi:hypothetical protein